MEYNLILFSFYLCTGNSHDGLSMGVVCRERDKDTKWEAVRTGVHFFL